MGATAALLVTGIGAGFSASSKKKAGDAQSNVDLYNARVAQNNSNLDELQAQDATARGQVAEQVHRKNVRAFIGSQRATLAAQGIDVNSGSAEDVQVDSAMQGEQDALTIRQNAAREAWGYRVKGANDLTQVEQLKAQSQIDKAAGKNAAIGTVLGAGGQILTAKYGFSSDPKTPKAGSSDPKTPKAGK